MSPTPSLTRFNQSPRDLGGRSRAFRVDQYNATDSALDLGAFAKQLKSDRFVASNGLDLPAIWETSTLSGHEGVVRDRALRQDRAR
mgnify:FL=1